MGASGDGRLELDELGSVIDHASSLEAPAADLLAGNDATTWSERLDAVGLTPWLRRHRTVLAVVSALVLVAGVTTAAWVRSRPPEQLTDLALTARDWVSGDSPGIVFYGDGTFSASYWVSPERPGDTATVLGLTGPGIRASQVHPVTGAPAENGAAVADVAAVIGCDDSRVLAATPADFRLLVRQTDAWGRSVDGALLLPSASATQWVDNLIGPCGQQLLTERVVATAVTVTPDAAHRSLLADVTVRNGFDQALSLSPTTGQGTAVFTWGDTGVVEPGATTVVRATMRVTDCAHPVLDGAYVPQVSEHRSTAQVPGLNLYASISESLYGGGAQLVARFSPAMAARADAMLQGFCAGLPAVRSDVVIGGSSPVDVATAFASNGDPSLVALRLALDVTTDADRVLVADSAQPEDLANGQQPVVLPAQATVRDGHAVLGLDWAARCDSVSPPPIVALTVVAGGRSWPVRVTLDDPQVRAAYVVACPALPVGDFPAVGWTSE
jgi:hypothetical protein